MFPTISEEDEGADKDGNGRRAVLILDQTRLPARAEQVRLTTLEEAAHAIRSMQVRGAPLIGATAAYGVALGLSATADDATLGHVLDTLAATRPTAVNLHWALARMRRVLAPLAPDRRRAAAWREARAIAAEDAAANAAIGRHGLALLEPLIRRRGRIDLMTHCNAGWLATVAHGTALAPIHAAHAAGLPVHVWVSETRPRNQGWLTAWELRQAGIAHTLIADNAAGLLMMQGKVDLLIVGADRIAANGDTANKIGTYLKALAARAHGIPFYVAAPASTIDFSCPSGADIPIEERAAAELAASLDSPAANPAFDITPAGLISGIITESGIHAPDALRTSSEQGA
ncbi:Methylthioribose-1-phosphate isomerase [Sterolibacterium denitrificans]|uniref:Methylthioribose-1-phosphate isomerase n=2 Tax=Sterolibacterium denitrificans TaxID=157592 RepID=A0A7Z7MW60_9PROT|nr:S-methyl-5-thioribose-1-phosphate isomerase [Sterolibacterium denitrificans]KYC29446.1 methylthioribose-1-phosphate isomerase [Sterolibacterium denitrificans]SMB31602.1 Methylthioribose-1-phosphate isomerase [Sterolibacterium denitrificans]